MNSQSFIDFLAAYGERHTPAMRYRDGEDFAAWQAAFRDTVSNLLGPVPERVEPTADIVDSVDCGDHVRHSLRIPVTDFTTLPAYLLVPKEATADEQRPGLVVTHGHTPLGIETMSGATGADTPEDERCCYGLLAVRAGYVVLSPAWWGWPQRDGHLARVGTRDKCNVIQMAAGMYGINVIALHIQDGQAAVDVLSARPEVDGTRIGCLGNSYGGRTAMWLSIFDDRIRVCVAAGSMNHFRERSLKLSSCGIQYPFGLLQYGDVPELFSLIAPRALQLQAGKQDPLITPEDRDAMAAVVRRAYHELDCEANFHYALHAEGHILLWDLAASFLARHLHRRPILPRRGTSVAASASMAD